MFRSYLFHSIRLEKCLSSCRIPKMFPHSPFQSIFTSHEATNDLISVINV